MNPADEPVRVRRSVLELGPRTRVAFAGLYVGVMAWVIVSAQFRPDHVFGFQMFNQSSKIEIQLAREVRGRRAAIPLADGEWQASDRGGTLRTFSWHDRVKDPVLGVLGRPVHARYGLDGQLFRLQFALADVLRHIPKDSETTALVASVWTRRNGRSPVLMRFRATR